MTTSAQRPRELDREPPALAGRQSPDERWREVLRFLIAGGVNMAFGYGVYAVLVVAGSGAATALLVATVIGTFFNFLTFGGYAFRRLEAPRLPAFLAAYAIVYVFNLALLYAVERLFGLDPLTGQLACLIVVAPTAYLMLKVGVFRNGQR